MLRRILLDYFANSALVALVNSPLSGRLTEIYQAAKRAIASDPGLMPTELQVYAVKYLLLSISLLNGDVLLAYPL